MDLTPELTRLLAEAEAEASIAAHGPPRLTDEQGVAASRERRRLIAAQRRPVASAKVEEFDRFAEAAEKAGKHVAREARAWSAMHRRQVHEADLLFVQHAQAGAAEYLARRRVSRIGLATPRRSAPSSGRPAARRSPSASRDGPDGDDGPSDGPGEAGHLAKPSTAPSWRWAHPWARWSA